MNELRERAIEMALKIGKRRLGEVSQVALESLIQDVSVIKNFPYTVVLINGKFAGVSKYNRNDAKLGSPWSKQRGLGLALDRAVTHFLKAQ